MAETEDDGVRAITTLLDTLRPLKPETRANVLDYVFKTLGITAPATNCQSNAVRPGSAVDWAYIGHWTDHKGEEIIGAKRAERWLLNSYNDAFGEYPPLNQEG